MEICLGQQLITACFFIIYVTFGMKMIFTIINKDSILQLCDTKIVEELRTMFWKNLGN